MSKGIATIQAVFLPAFKREEIFTELGNVSHPFFSWRKVVFPKIGMGTPKWMV